MNGHITEKQRSVTPSMHLGKRKRSASPEKAQVNGNSSHSDANIDNIVREIKQYDISLSLMGCPLPNSAKDMPQSKKQKVETDTDTIEARLRSQYYSSTDELSADFQRAISQIKNGNLPSNGYDEKSLSSDIDKIQHILSSYSHSSVSSPVKVTRQPVERAGQVLTLRSAVEGGGTRQLFTGLRLRPAKGVEPNEIDARSLPNGLEIADSAVSATASVAVEKEARTVGEVFRQYRNVRQLEQPKSSRGSRDSVLEFTSPIEMLRPSNKEDHRLAFLNAGCWLEYSIPSFDPVQQHSQHSKPFAKDTEALFKAAFSSFAPSQDNSNAIISPGDRSRQWYRRHGAKAMAKITGEVADSPFDSVVEYPEIGDDFAQVISEFVPEDAGALQSMFNAPTRGNEPDDILDEISELVQTLSSYQELRDVDKNRVVNVNVKPTKPELEIFELLRSQLKILVDSLPPFAIAKLDGDKLGALNVSTTIVVPTTDFVGTGQPDEYTIRRLRLAQAQQATAQRPLNQPQPTSRNSYTTSGTNAAAYNNNARIYNNVTTTPSLPGYAQRNQHMYNTPRASASGNAAYNQTPNYNRNQQPFPNATIQQFQRLQQNNYSANNNQQTPYNQQRGAVSSSQQAVQNNSTAYANRGSTSAQPLTNGQAYPQQTPQRHYSGHTSGQTPYQANSYNQVAPNATIQQAKAAIQMQKQQPLSQSPQPQSIQSVQQQKQASGTPQPAPPRTASVVSSTARNATDKPADEVSLRGGADVQRAAQQQAMHMQQQSMQNATTATAATTSYNVLHRNLQGQLYAPAMHGASALPLDPMIAQMQENVQLLHAQAMQGQDQSQRYIMNNPGVQLAFPQTTQLHSQGMHTNTSSVPLKRPLLDSDVGDTRPKKKRGRKPKAKWTLI